MNQFLSFQFSVFLLATEIRKQIFPDKQHTYVGKRGRIILCVAKIQSNPPHLRDSYKSRHCLAAALCGLSTAVPLKARSDILTKFNFLKLLCHQIYMPLLLGVNLQSDPVSFSICSLKGKMDIMFIFIFVYGNFTLLQNSERRW